MTDSVVPTVTSLVVTLVIAGATDPVRLGMQLLGGRVTAAGVGDASDALIALENLLGVLNRDDDGDWFIRAEAADKVEAADRVVALMRGGAGCPE